jgi:hypothetical protein
LHDNSTNIGRILMFWRNILKKDQKKKQLLKKEMNPGDIYLKPLAFPKWTLYIKYNDLFIAINWWQIQKKGLLHNEWIIIFKGDPPQDKIFHP